MEFDTSAPVMVTGATGYVAGWLVRRLLEEGFTVHATVRDPENRDKLKYLDDLAAELPGTIKYFQAELLDADAFAPAMDGCRVVFHTASPFTMVVADPQRDLVDPAEQGTRNVLEQANRTETVKRVVVTSSCAAIFGDSADLAKTPGGIFTEDVWNTSSSLNHQAYSYSKLRAEKVAWELADAQDRWQLVTINPSLVLGPGISPRSSSESFNLFRQFGTGKLKTGVPDYRIGAVDVRDVAEAHLAAGFSDTAKGRYIVSGKDSSFPEIAKLLREQFGDAYPFPKSVLPKWLVWLVGPLADKTMTRKMVSLNVGLPWRADNSKSKRELGLRYRPLADTVRDMFQQMLDNGVVKKRA